MTLAKAVLIVGIFFTLVFGLSYVATHRYAIVATSQSDRRGSAFVLDRLTGQTRFVGYHGWYKLPRLTDVEAAIQRMADGG